MGDPHLTDVHLSDSFELDKAVGYLQTQDVEKQCSNIFPSNNNGSQLIVDNDDNDSFGEVANSYAVRNEHEHSVTPQSFYSSVLQKILKQGHEHDHFNIDRSLIRKQYARIERIRPGRKSVNYFAFDELNYHHKKAMEKKNWQIKNGETNREIPSHQPCVQNQDLIFTENIDCFRITKQNSSVSENNYEYNKKEAKEYKSNIEGSNHYALKYVSKEQINCSMDRMNQTTSFRIDNQLVPQSSWDINDEYKNVDSKGIRPKDHKQSELFRLKSNRESTYGSRDKINEFAVEKEHKVYSHLKKMNVEECNLPNESEDAYAKFITEITETLQQQFVGFQDPKPKFDSHNNNKAMGRDRVIIQKALDRKQHQVNETLVYAEKNQPESRGKHTRIIISEMNNISQRSKRNQHKTNRNHRWNCNENDQLKKYKYDNLRPKSSNLQSGNKFNGIISNDFQSGINDMGWALAPVGNPNVVNGAMQYPLLYPEYVLPQFYQYWPSNYLGNTNSLINVPNHQNCLWSTTVPTYQNTVNSLAESNALLPPVPQPYTGVAGHNWPTIRKPLKNEEPEEKNDFPVYVKPPVVGSNETEELRTAFIKYVKLLKYKLYKKNVRKRKQMERRERNHKLWMESKPANSEPLGGELEEGMLPSQNLNLCQEESDKTESNVPGSTEENKDTLDTLLSHEIRPHSSLDGSEMNDLLNTISQNNVQLETFHDKYTAIYDENDPKDTTFTETPANDVLNLTLDSFEISEDDSLRERSSRGNNRPIDHISTRERYLHSPPHPIYGPVCHWKEAFLDEYITSQVSNDLDK